MTILPFDKKKKQAIIFIGIQASGKSTFYNRLLADGSYNHISLDCLHTRHKEYLELMDCLNNGRSFVIDNTNPEVSDRARYICKAKEYDYHIIGIFFQSIVKDCVKRNEERGRRKENSPAIMMVLIQFLLFLVFIIFNFQLSIFNDQFFSKSESSPV